VRVRRLLALSIVSLSLTAQAQPASPAVRALSGPLSLHGRVEASREHSCSQSFETSRTTIDLALTVDAGGRSTLVAESLAQTTSGDAGARFGVGSSSLTQTLSRRTLTGQATRSTTELEIRFDHAEDVSMRWAGPGVGTLTGATTPTTVALTMHCARLDTPVLPAVQTTPEQATTHALLRCAFDVPPAFVEYDETNELFFGRGAGVRVVSHQGGWDPLGTRAVRLAP
jgi:hypothetical protein